MTFPHLKNGAVVLVSAQLPVGSVAALEESFARQAGGRTVSFACSPENLRLGRALEVFRNPGRIIVGVRDDRTRAILAPLLETFCPTLIWMSVESAEMVKHGLNSFLAVSVTIANELATLCERVGADASDLERGLRSDPRVGPGAYVRAGPAFAGGTLARDVNFLRGLGRQHHLAMPVMDGIIASNRAHGEWALGHLRRTLQPLAGRTVGVLGLAYKPGTSALRRSPSIALIRALIGDGARVQAFDPHVPSLPDDLQPVVLGADARSAAKDADALVVATECPEFRRLTVDEVAGVMAGRVILDRPLSRSGIRRRPAPVPDLGWTDVMKLAGRTAIITGASLGLGAEIAQHFAAEGAAGDCARNAGELEAQRARLRRTTPVRIVRAAPTFPRTRTSTPCSPPRSRRSEKSTSW